MLTCRLTSASLVFSAGDIAAPQPIVTEVGREEDQCRLYYYQFSLANACRNEIKYQFGLSAVPFEFPSTREDRAMGKSKFIYGCSTTEGSFRAALGRAVKIDCLVKMDAETLISRGIKDPSLCSVTGCVDSRSVHEILGSKIDYDTIMIFQLPSGFFAQEPRFVPRTGAHREDDGWLLTYVFDESQLDSSGECLPDAKSELWIIDARDMKTIVGRVQLTQRVTYGLHGAFFNEKQVMSQRPVETIRSLKHPTEQTDWGLWTIVRDRLERMVG